MIQTIKRFGYATLSLALVATAALSPAAISSEQSTALKSLNQAFAKLLAPIQDANTQASLTFKKIKTDAVRALNVSVAADFKKTGPANTVEVSIDHLRYKYGDGTQPTTSFKGFIGVDLTKILSQDELKRMIPDIQKELQDMVSDTAQQLGDAAKVSVRVYDEHQDDQGNYVSLRGTVKLHIDLTQLPAGNPSSMVPITDFVAHLNVDLAQGVKLSGVVTSNPAYEGFQQDQTGLKEYLDKLLAQDQDTLGEAAEGFGFLNAIAQEIVNGQSL